MKRIIKIACVIVVCVSCAVIFGAVVAARVPRENLVYYLIFIWGVCVVAAVISTQIILLHEKAALYQKSRYEDNLFGILRIAEFSKIFEQVTENPQGECALIVVAINHFYEFAHRNKEDIIEKVIENLAAQLYENSGEHDTVARWYSDRFVVLFSYQSNEEILQYIEDVSAGVNEISLTFGAVAPIVDGGTFEDSQERLMDTLRKAQSAGIQFMMHDERANRNLKREIREKIHSTLANKEFKVVLQPKFDIATGECCGAEAFVRWRKDRNNFYSPQMFIPILEETGNLLKMEAQVIEQICEVQKDWNKQGKQALPISVNISSRNFLDSKFITDILSSVQASEIADNLLEFDITDSSVSLSVKNLKELDDDFFGYDILMSVEEKRFVLQMLEDMPIKAIKLSGKLFSLIAEDQSTYDMMKTMIRIANKQGIYVIAERVETESQLELAKRLGCCMAQGYYYSPALPIPEFTARFIQSETKNQ